MLYTVKRYLGIVVFIIVIIAGIIYFNVSQSLNSKVTNQEETGEEIVQLAGEDDEGNDVDSESIQAFVVDIKGAITSPGVYEMKEGDRVTDIINLAGGFTKEANETEINLAQKLQDEMVIIVPEKGQGNAETTSTSKEGISGESITKIKLNTATQEELETLNGIGPSKAQAIIAYREEHGTFQKIEDILEVSGIGEKTLDAFKDDIIVP